MSEYQYYEFAAIDRPLTTVHRQQLRAISSRAHITATSFVNTYNFGDLKADPLKLLERYFVLFIYVANWGMRWFAMRVPTRAAMPISARRCGGDCAGASRVPRLLRRAGLRESCVPRREHSRRSAPALQRNAR